MRYVKFRRDIREVCLHPSVKISAQARPGRASSEQHQQGSGAGESVRLSGVTHHQEPLLSPTGILAGQNTSAHNKES